MAVHERPGTEGFLDQLTDPWLALAADLADRMDLVTDVDELRLGVAVSRGLLIEVLASGEVDGPTVSLHRFLDMWEASSLADAAVVLVGDRAERAIRLAGARRMGESGGTSRGDRNPHAGAPFTDDDAAIAAALEDVSVPALLCSLVHITGDPSWIRGDLRPADVGAQRLPGRHDRRSSRPRSAAGRCRRSPPIRDGGCVLPPPPSAELVARDDVVPRVRTGRPDASCRCSSRTCTSTAPTPAPSRGATRSPPTSGPTRTSS